MGKTIRKKSKRDRKRLKQENRKRRDRSNKYAEAFPKKET